VSYHPLSNYLGEVDGCSLFESLLSGARTQVTVRRKVVDATYFSPAVPSTHKPAFVVGEGVSVVAPNALPGAVGAGARQAVAAALCRTGGRQDGDGHLHLAAAVRHPGRRDHLGHAA
jgi:hypothetical protein